MKDRDYLLFVGGPASGVWIEVSYRHLNVLRPASPLKLDKGYAEDKTFMVEYDVYIRETVRMGRYREADFLRHESLFDTQEAVVKFARMVGWIV